MSGADPQPCLVKVPADHGWTLAHPCHSIRTWQRLACSSTLPALAPTLPSVSPAGAVGVPLGHDWAVSKCCVTPHCAFSYFQSPQIDGLRAAGPGSPGVRDLSALTESYKHPPGSGWATPALSDNQQHLAQPLPNKPNSSRSCKGAADISTPSRTKLRSGLCLSPPGVTAMPRCRGRWALASQPPWVTHTCPADWCLSQFAQEKATKPPWGRGVWVSPRTQG